MRFLENLANCHDISIFRTVGVSSDVVKRVIATSVTGNDGESDKLRF